MGGNPGWGICRWLKQPLCCYLVWCYLHVFVKRSRNSIAPLCPLPTRVDTRTCVPLCQPLLVAVDVPSLSFAADGRFQCWLFISEADLSQRVLLLSVNMFQVYEAWFWCCLHVGEGGGGLGWDDRGCLLSLWLKTNRAGREEQTHPFATGDFPPAAPHCSPQEQPRAAHPCSSSIP